MRKGKNEKNLTYINRCDNYETLKETYDMLFKYITIDKDKKVYFPFYCKGLINDYTFPFNVIHNDLDFFETKVEFDMIIDNPPFTIKEKIIRKCIELDKPFALLLALDTLDRQYISKLFHDKDFTIIIPKKRYNFINKNSKVSMPFKTAWFCIGFGLDKQIIFD